MLEEVEVAPGELGKVMGFARSAAHRAGKQGATVGFDLEMQLVGLPGHIEPLADQLPRRRHPEPQGENVVGVHAPLSVPFRRKGATVLAPVKGKPPLRPAACPVAGRDIA